MYSTPHLRSHHISATLCIISQHSGQTEVVGNDGIQWGMCERDGVCVCNIERASLGERRCPSVCVSVRETPVSVYERDGVCQCVRETRCVCSSFDGLHAV